MSSLADLPNLVGFFSYSRNDDEGDDGAVSALANRIYRELRSQLGRTERTFKLWRDKDALAAGDHWKGKLKASVSESVFFILIVSPSAVNSNFCRFEFDSFVEREKELGRDDLVFPVLYVSVPELEDNRKEADPVLSTIANRQYVDWRHIRHRDVNSSEVKLTVEQFCSIISKKLRAPWTSPEEIAAQRLADEQRRNQEAKTKRREEQEHQRVEREKQAEEERLRKHAERAEQKRQEKEERERRERQGDVSMTDQYGSFEMMLQHETEEVDFRIRKNIRSSMVAVVAPHGGGIEPGTSEIAEAIAGDDLSLYIFEGIKSSDNGVLHITSTNFYEGRCDKVIGSCSVVTTVHGENGENSVVFLGGKNDKNATEANRLRAAIEGSLKNHGFTVSQPRDGHEGSHQNNLCNRGKSDAGIQLELSMGLRRTMFENVGTRAGRKAKKPPFHDFVAAIREALMGPAKPAT